MNTTHKSGQRNRRALRTAKLYFVYTKPRVWLLLVFAAAIGSFVAVEEFTWYTSFLISIAIVATVLGSAGAEALTNYIDRGMDSIMIRTMNRPLANGKIKPRNALIFGFSLISASLALLLVTGKIYAFGFMLAGILDNVMVYSYLLKKRTPWSIILGGFSGGLPVIVGWYTVTSQFSYVPWFLFALVVVWIPIHVWSLAYRYKDDYAKAKVPMLPVVYSDNISALCISGSAIILIIFSLIPFFFGFQTIYYLIVIVALSIPMMMFSIHFIRHPDLKSSFQLFKYSSPYLSVVLALFVIFRFF